MGGVDLLISASFATPASEDEVRSRMVAGAADGDRAVHWQALFLALDGRRLVGHLQAPDATAALTAWLRAGLPPADACSPSTLDAGTGHCANVVVEAAQGPPCDRSAGHVEPGFSTYLPSECLVNHRVSLVRTARSLDGRQHLAFYHAPDTEAVRLAQRHGNIGAGRVWACRQIALPDAESD